MKVNVQINGEVITGALTSQKQSAHFISTDHKHRILLERPEIMICGEEDRNAIWICGDERIDDKTFRKADYTFYPIK